MIPSEFTSIKKQLYSLSILHSSVSATGGWRRLQTVEATLQCFSLVEPPGDCAVLHKIGPVSFLRNTDQRHAVKCFTLQTVASGAIPFVHCLPIYQLPNHILKCEIKRQVEPQPYGSVSINLKDFQHLDLELSFRTASFFFLL